MIFVFVGPLSACAPATTLKSNHVPVYEINTVEALPKGGIHHVTADETLYAIAWRYGFDYRVLAKRNNIAPPYPIKTGQVIYLTKRECRTPRSIHVKAAPQSTLPAQECSLKHLAPPAESERQVKVTQWQWPAKGPLFGHFSSFNKGINVLGHRGDAIVATAAGIVVYSGNGLRSYGNLIIIKHNSMFLSAYAHNNRLLVKEGEKVKKGQKIAEMGNTGTQMVMLHFEIRRNGKPVNPLFYLGKKI